jgi:hypothetical protein
MPRRVTDKLIIWQDGALHRPENAIAADTDVQERIDLRDDEGDWPVGEAFEGECSNNKGTGTGGTAEAFYNRAENDDEDFEKVRVRSSPRSEVC